MTGTEIISLLNNNISTVCSAVSSVAGAVITAIFLRSKTSTVEFEKIKAGKLQEVADDLLDSGKMTYTEFYRAKNFLKVAQIADEEYRKTPHTEEKGNYDFDWFIRFYDAVGNISNEQMQQIWARILSGEIQHPHSYSLRCIDILKNLNQEEANLFGKVCMHCIHYEGRHFLPSYDEYMEHCDIAFSDIMTLDELGLISSNALIVLNVPITTQGNLLFSNDSLMIMAATQKDVTDTLRIKQYPLTSVGAEFAKVINSQTSDEDFVEFAKALEKSKPETANISLHKVLNREGNQFRYNPENLLELNKG